MKSSDFRRQLYSWYKKHQRIHPWMVDNDPYLVWLFEIIMQQTRIAQGTPYFEKFKNHFPTVKELAEADIDKVLKLWEGLGYYSRARNMHETAKHIHHNLAGKFPNNKKDIQALKGVGPYTSSAIASFSFGEATAVVDGNVIRVLARVCGINRAIDSKEGKLALEKYATKYLDKKDPAKYNQAIMDFGALQCKPKSPNCSSCELNKHCIAYSNNQVQTIPQKKKKLKRRKRFFHYLILQHKTKLLIQQRTEKDIWKLLFEFPLLEKESLKELECKEIKSWLLSTLGYDGGFKILSDITVHKQVLTHQDINARFYKLQLDKPTMTVDGQYKKVSRSSLKQYAVPRIIDWYLNDKSISLFE